MYSRQETFDIVVKHLLTQNRKCSVDGSCLYRGPNGDRCAAGVLIPDDRYNYDMENHSILNWCGKLMTDCIVSQLMVELGHDVMLVGRLQKVHDQNDPLHWETQLKKLASEEGLVFNG